MSYTQKLFMRWFHSVAYDGHLYLMCVVCDVTFMFPNTNVLAKFVNIICIFFYTHSPYFMCHCTEYKLSALQVKDIGGKYSQHCDTAVHNCKNRRLHIKTGSKTHSSLRQSNLQLQNETALMSCRIRAVEHNKCAAGLAGIHEFR